MPKQTILLNRFWKGEVSDLISGQVDIQDVLMSMKTCQNLLPLPQGPVRRRPGSIYVGQTDGSGADKARLYPYERTDLQAYVVEFTDLKARFYTAGALIESGGSPVSIVTPYTAAQLFELQFAQNKDELYIAHPSHHLKILKRTTDDYTWTLTNATMTNDAAAAVFNSADNYPRTLCFYQSRLIVASTNNDKQTVWGSKVGDYTKFNDDKASPTDADGWKFPLADERSATIKWVTGGSDLLLGTTAAGWIMTGGGAPLTPTNVQAQPQVFWGAYPLQPAKIGNLVLYLLKNQKFIRAMQYRYERNGYEAPEATYAAKHIGESGIVQWDVQTSPHTILWAVRADGVLVTWSYEHPNVSAWARQVTDGIVESVAVIPNGFEDQVWISVKRTINGSDYRYVEYFNTHEVANQEDLVFSDSAKIYDGGAAYAISAITLNDPIRVTVTGHPFVTGDIVRILGIVGTTQLNGEYYQVTKIDANNVDLYLVDGSDGIDGTLEQLTIDVDPSPNNFIVGGTITGGTSGETCTVVSVIDSKNYMVNARSGAFTDGEVLSDGTNSADCGTGYPVFDAVYDAYVSGGTMQKFFKTITGLGHLEAKSVTVLEDGANHPNRTVSSGEITLQTYAQVAVVGLPFTSILQPMRVEGGGQRGFTLGKYKKIYRLFIRFIESLGAKVGQSLDNLQVIPFRTGADPMSEADALYTGDKQVHFKGDYTGDNWLFIVQDQPLPMIVAAIAVDLEGYEGD